MASRIKRGKKKTDNKAILWLLCIAIAIIAVYMQVKWMKTEIVAIQPTQKIPCMHCEGSAKIRNPEDAPNHMDCPYCFGTGFRYVRKLGREFEICPVCVGMGRESYSAGDLPEQCRACKGWGVFKIAFEQVKPAKEIKPYIDDPPEPPPTNAPPPKVEAFDPNELLRL